MTENLPNEHRRRRPREGVFIEKWIANTVLGILGAALLGGIGTSVKALIMLGRIEERLISQDSKDASQDKRLDQHDQNFLGVKHDFERVWDKIGSIRAATPKETAQINGKSATSAN